MHPNTWGVNPCHMLLGGLTVFPACFDKGPTHPQLGLTPITVHSNASLKVVLNQILGGCSQPAHPPSPFPVVLNQLLGGCAQRTIP